MSTIGLLTAVLLLALIALLTTLGGTLVVVGSHVLSRGIDHMLGTSVPDPRRRW